MAHQFLETYPHFGDLIFVHNQMYNSAIFQQAKRRNNQPEWVELNALYRQAEDEDFLFFSGLTPVSEDLAERLIFRTGLQDEQGDSLLLACSKNRKPGATSPWFGSLFMMESAYKRNLQFAGYAEGEWLKKWAILRAGPQRDYKGVLKELKELAVSDEKWYFGDEEDDSYPILSNYLRYTFYKLWMDQRIEYSSNGRLAALNTGLVDFKYDDIYMMFERLNVPVNDCLWGYKGVCIAGEQGLGKELTQNFRRPLPMRAHFFDKTSSMIYELDCEMPPENQMPYVDYDHIIHDNLRRFPLAFLKKVSAGFPAVMELLNEDTKNYSIERLNNHWAKIIDAMDEELVFHIKTDIERALKIAIKRVAWNYKTAIPVYFPTRDIISWLLPLSLSSNISAPDVALVVERYENGNHEGHTILDLDMAYTNARLVCKPDSDWLRPDIKKSAAKTLEQRAREETEEHSQEESDPFLGTKVQLTVLEVRPNGGIRGTFGDGTMGTVARYLLQQPAEEYVGKTVAALVVDQNPQKTGYILKPIEHDETAGAEPTYAPAVFEANHTAGSRSSEYSDPMPPAAVSKAVGLSDSTFSPVEHTAGEMDPYIGTEVAFYVQEVRPNGGIRGVFAGECAGTISKARLPEEPASYVGRTVTARVLEQNPQKTGYVLILPDSPVSVCTMLGQPPRQQDVGQVFWLEDLEIRSGYKGLQGMVNGVFATIAKKHLAQADLNLYQGRRIQVRVQAINPQKSGYVLVPVVEGERIP